MIKTVLLVGATGSGKTTLVNAMANYILGVQFKDPFRFRIVQSETDDDESINQAESQTKWVTTYTIHANEDSKIRYTVNIVDTPGFESTEGIERDDVIISQIKELFWSPLPTGLQTVHAVCFIVKAPDARLTHSQKYVFRSILSLFGEDIKECIHTIVTFSDGETPPVLSAIERMVDGSNVLPYQSYFPVNNSALYASHSRMSTLFWEMGFDSLEKFFLTLECLTSKSLTVTKRVLYRRDALENTLRNFQEEVEIGMEKMNTIHQELKIFHEHETDIKSNEYFSYHLPATKMMKVELRLSGTQPVILVCHQCKTNCQIMSSNGESCNSHFDENGKCKTCRSRCEQQEHEQTNWMYKGVRQIDFKYFSEKQKLYEENRGRKVSFGEIIQLMEKEVEDISYRIEHCMGLIKIHLEKLHELALYPDRPCTIDYLDMLIKHEMRQKDEGYMERIQTLQKIKDKEEFQDKNETFREKAEEIKEKIRNVKETKKEKLRKAQKKFRK